MKALIYAPIHEIGQWQWLPSIHFTTMQDSNVARLYCDIDTLTIWECELKVMVEKDRYSGSFGGSMGEGSKC